MSAEAKAEKAKKELFKDALELVMRVDEGKARELKERWEKEFGPFERNYLS
jgi:hypothetical protein